MVVVGVEGKFWDRMARYVVWLIPGMDVEIRSLCLFLFDLVESFALNCNLFPLYKLS